MRTPVLSALPLLPERIANCLGTRMGTKQSAHGLDTPLVCRKHCGRLIRQARDIPAQRIFLSIAQAARPVLDRFDEIVLPLLETLFLGLGQSLSCVFQSLLKARIDEIDLIVSKGGEDRRRFVDDAPCHDVEQVIDLALHS